jgi:hypothetical protein
MISELGYVLVYREDRGRSEAGGLGDSFDWRVQRGMEGGWGALLGSPVGGLFLLIHHTLGAHMYRRFRIVPTGADAGLVETITDAVSIHSIKKAEYARRLATGQQGLGHVTLLDHFRAVSLCLSLQFRLRRTDAGLNGRSSASQVWRSSLERNRHSRAR